SGLAFQRHGSGVSRPPFVTLASSVPTDIFPRPAGAGSTLRRSSRASNSPHNLDPQPGPILASTTGSILTSGEDAATRDRGFPGIHPLLGTLQERQLGGQAEDYAVENDALFAAHRRVLPGP